MMQFRRLLFILLVATFHVGITESQFIPIFDWISSFFGSYEQPGYTSVRNITDQVEERIYPTSSWACSEQFATPVTKDSKTAESFMTILRYIQGKNELGKKIEMTIPIVTKIDHRNGNLRSYEMCFFLPTEFQKSPPKPVDNRVKIVTYPPLRVYSKMYGGYSSQTVETSQVASLSEVLRNQSIPYFEMRDGDRATYFVAGYDSPTKFWNRRNEVWLLSKDTPKSINHHFTTAVRQQGGDATGEDAETSEMNEPV
ncbi:heme-binding protein 2 [Folsomia candida]|uniref:Heme-binding protein 2 n=1 Tax=Folsomia candida TaxID=158441 RepID=A0A226EV46_FOLCA|nr:heme-binding protein 2 [Folsomia candida]OXA61495.1 Heme-binding protein 2 [Folsomia candida]